MVEPRCLVDNNILIRWVQPYDPDYHATREALAILPSRHTVLCHTSQNFGEYWNACTRPLVRNGYGLLPQEAEQRARQFEQRLRLLADDISVHNKWRRLLVLYAVSGIQVHDTRLVAAMHMHEVKQILTFNTKDFVRFTDFEALRPSDVVARS